MSGRPGRLLDTSLIEAGIDRKKVYVTNVVKHFKWEPRGKRRIHKKPSASEIAACRPWLDAELASVKPAVIVCLGATAAQAVGKNLSRHRPARRTHRIFARPQCDGYRASVIHLASADEECRHNEEQKFVADLKKIKKLKI